MTNYLKIAFNSEYLYGQNIHISNSRNDPLIYYEVNQYPRRWNGFRCFSFHRQKLFHFFYTFPLGERVVLGGSPGPVEFFESLKNTTIENARLLNSQRYQRKPRTMWKLGGKLP